MRLASFVAAAGVAVAPCPARAQVVEPAPAVASGDATARAARDEADLRGGGVMRVALLGAYRSLYDLGLVAGGASFSYGVGAPITANLELRVLGGRSLGGVAFADATALGTLEGALPGGLRLGAGIGAASFVYARATTGDFVGSLGFAGLVRLGYDFGRRRAFYVTTDCDFEYRLGPAVVWGPTLAVGWRF